MRRELNPLTQIAAALVKRLSVGEAGELQTEQVRLAGVVAGLWHCYGELAEVIGRLPVDSPAAVERPERFDTFPPGDPVSIEGSASPADSRIVLRDQLGLEQIQLLIEDLTETVLQAPVLASRELLCLLRELEPSVVEQLTALVGDAGANTDDIPGGP